MTLTIPTNYVVETCCHDGCHVQFAFTRGYYDDVRQSGAWWYCPNGHRQHYTGPTDAQKLRDAQARELALKDQAAAAVRDAEDLRVALLRDRQRFANGVCPCCNRSFAEVARHIKTQHPDYDVTEIRVDDGYQCSCGQAFGSLHGLRIHQGRMRHDGWDSPNASRWAAHLTEIGS